MLLAKRVSFLSVCDSCAADRNKTKQDETKQDKTRDKTGREKTRRGGGERCCVPPVALSRRACSPGS